MINWLHTASGWIAESLSPASCEQYFGWQGGLVIVDAKYGSLDAIMELERHLASQAAAGPASEPLHAESAPAAPSLPGPTHVRV